MKKFITLTSLLAISGLAVAQGGFQSSSTPSAGGFVSGQDVTTVQAAKQARDDTFVSIEGNIVKSLGDDDFIFRDLAGQEIRIDVSDRAWNGQTITPNDRIIIQGKVDKDGFSTEIEVKNIIKK